MLRCIPVTDHPTVHYACEELIRHFALLRPVWQGDEPVLRVGLHLMEHELPHVADPEQDDAIAIWLRNGQGVITGINPRSVLIAAYRFLHELGFWFVKPGKEGTILRYNGKTELSITEAASYRHRGFCIEGAVSFENVLDFVEWMPKNGFNTYFTQFLVPYEFFKTWYEHRNNPLLANSEAVPTVEEVEAFTYGPLNEALKKRSLVFQAAGHGWTTNTVGIRGLGWDEGQEPEERYTHWLAQIDGRRALFHSKPLNTNLCYSNLEVRDAITEQVLCFLRRYPQVDVIHFWLADEGNNSCECTECCKKRPSEFYIDMLNLLDEKLTAAGLKTKIVFLAYLDLLWPPQKGGIYNPDRFIFMFAPMSRSYSDPLPSAAEEIQLPPFERNRLVMPREGRKNIAFLRAWQNRINCDSFIYEYHYMWDLFKDLSDYGNAKILWQDICNLQQLGLNGYISCQQTRVFLPCGFGMHVLGRTLWNRAADFDDMAEAFFDALFTDQAKAIRDMAAFVSRMFHPEWIRGEMHVEETFAADFACLRQTCLDASRQYMQYALAHQGVEAAIWRTMSFWCDVCASFAHYLEACVNSNTGERTVRLANLKHMVCVHEIEQQGELDVYWFIKTLEQMIEPAVC